MLILLCGLDRTGKSTVAERFKKDGYQVYHMSAPDKKYTQPGYAGASYLEEYVDLLMSFNGKDVVMDRFWDGEFIWPHVYGRQPLLTEEDIEVIMEVESTMGVQRIMMHDPNTEAHWQRCVENKEPLTKAQFLKAKSLYEKLAEKYGFEKKTLKDFVDVNKENPQLGKAGVQASSQVTSSTNDNSARPESNKSTKNTSPAQPELSKLEKANAINEVLSKRIIKSKGEVFDSLENEIRDFLNERLGRIFGETKNEEFTKDEIILLKLMCRRVKEKENK